VTRDDDAMGCELKAAVALVVRGVAKEEAASGAWRQLMRGSSGSVGIAGTAKYAEVGVLTWILASSRYMLCKLNNFD
jgi:hypothetical protein